VTLVLVLVMLAGLFLIPIGLPGLWVIAGAALLFSYLSPTGAPGIVSIIVLVVLAVVAELLEWMITGRVTRRYGGSRRAGWGAILGGAAGAIVGVPIPVIGSMIGAFAGAFVGALVAEYSRGEQSAGAVKVATGAVVGRAIAVAMKVGIGVVMIVWTLVALLAMH
jgi:uncharacterized protein YqgC (DUF456 family)